jgi:hypothetical protein
LASGSGVPSDQRNQRAFLISISQLGARAAIGRYDDGVGKKSRHPANRAGAAGSGPDEALDRALAELWQSIAVGDVLNAEFQTSAFVTLPELTDGSPEDTEALADALIDAASTYPSADGSGSEAAAFCRLLMALGSRSVKRAASEALAGFTEDDIYPPGWVTSIGKPTPGRAWRRHDVFGEAEVIAVTFSYDDAEHALLVAIDLAELPTVSMVAMGDDADGMLATVRDQGEPHQRFDEITLAEARARTQGPLARAGEDPDFDLDDSSILLLPLARSRVRRLPTGDLGRAAVYTAADRAAAVEEFLRSPEAADAGDQDSARFWATVLTGYGSRVPDEAPAQVGPHKIAAMLLVHAVGAFTLTDAQRTGIGPAVTAWTRWAAGRQGLDEAATDLVMTSLAETLDAFPGEYDDPYATACRGYLRDVATPDVDLGWLADEFARRRFAVPLPGERDPHAVGVDAIDPRGRAEITLAEFAECGDGGAATIRLLSAVPRIVEEIWHDNPATTWQKARKLLAEGHARHDVLHRLAG